MNFFDFSAQKGPLVDLLAKIMILSAQTAPAGRLSGQTYDFACPKGHCGQT